MKTSRVKGIVFDLDGTLIDSKSDILSAFSYAFENLGKEKPEDDVLIHTIGARLEECFRPFLGDDENLLKKAAKLFRIHYEKHFLDNTIPFEGVEFLLKNLSNKCQLAVATMKKGSYARKVIDNFNWDKYFKSVVGAEEGLKAKPDPEMLQKAISNLSLTKKEVIYIGDTEVDFLTARNCGVDFIYVNWGYGRLNGKFEKILNVKKPLEILSLINSI